MYNPYRKKRLIMRLLIQGIDYAPVQIGVGKYTRAMAEWLAEQRHEVRVITAPPFYPDWRVAENYSGWKYRRKIVNNDSPDSLYPNDMMSLISSCPQS